MAAATVLVATTASDQELMLAAQLIKRSSLKLIAASICEKETQRRGAGKTAYFVRYKRMTIPTSPITEGVDPTANTLSVELFQVTQDQWGDVIIITDLVELTTSHPVVQQALELLSDNAQRVIDREVQIVWIANTNIQYGDLSVTTRRTITGGMKMALAVSNKALVTLSDAGAVPRNGPTNSLRVESNGDLRQGAAYLAVCGPQVMADVRDQTTFVNVAQYSNPKALYNMETGLWGGSRWVETNFIPKFQRLGNDTVAVASGNAFGTNTPLVTAIDNGSAGPVGALNSAVTFFFKVTRTDLQRGFEEYISREHSMASTATGNNESFKFDFGGLTAGFEFAIYFDTVTTGGTGTDATMKLVQAHIAVGAIVYVIANPSTGANPPDHTGAGLVVHPVYFHAAMSCKWVGLQNLSVHRSRDGATTDNPLELRRTLGYKFTGKTIVPDSTRLLRAEVCSAY